MAQRRARRFIPSALPLAPSVLGMSRSPLLSVRLPALPRDRRAAVRQRVTPGFLSLNRTFQECFGFNSSVPESAAEPGALLAEKSSGPSPDSRSLCVSLFPGCTSHRQRGFRRKPDPRVCLGHGSRFPYFPFSRACCEDSKRYGPGASKGIIKG